MQVLFLWDSQHAADPILARQVGADAGASPEVQQAALDMATAAWDQRSASDAWATRVAPQWPTNRQPAVDRALLRLGIWELTASATPPKVVIDEAIELAKEYSTEQSARFVNAVLDAILKEHRSLTSAGPLIIESPGPGPAAPGQPAEPAATEAPAELAPPAAPAEPADPGGADEPAGPVPPEQPQP